jgi:hypothetical protein
MHPNVSATGNIADKTTLALRHPLNAFVFNKIGSFATTTVSFDEPKVAIVDASVSQFDSSTNVVTCNVDGAVEQIDHCLIFKNVLDVRTLIGRVCPVDNNTSRFKFYHDLTQRDVGQIKYEIEPVFLSYMHGARVKTNDVICVAPPTIIKTTSISSDNMRDIKQNAQEVEPISKDTSIKTDDFIRGSSL